MTGTVAANIAASPNKNDVDKADMAHNEPIFNELTLFHRCLKNNCSWQLTILRFYLSSGDSAMLVAQTKSNYPFFNQHGTWQNQSEDTLNQYILYLATVLWR